MTEHAEFDIKEVVGTISNKSKKWNKELCIISWFGNEPKYDLREWSRDHSEMKKGVTLSIEELRRLKELVNEMEELK